MGMDVYGNNPKTEKGEYFRANVWYWHPLWDCLEQLHPTLCSKVQYPHENSGDGLKSTDALALSKPLKKDLDNGIIEKYIKQYYEHLDSIPLEDCSYCDQKGTRNWPQQDGSVLTKQCNVCNGTLQVKSFVTHYHMDLDLMKEFQLFLEDCGGFRIC